MNQIVIRHFVLKLCRQHGWSWGPDPHQLVHAATRSLPQMIADELEKLLPVDQKDLAIRHLKVRVPVNLSVLLSLKESGSQQSDTTTLVKIISGTLRYALKHQVNIEQGDSLFSDTREAIEQDSESEGDLIRKNVCDLLVDWFQSGSLFVRLKEFSPDTRKQWERLALDTVSLIPASSRTVSGSTVEKDRYVDGLVAAIPTDIDSDIRRLVLLSGLLQKCSGSIKQNELTAILDRHIPVLHEDYPQVADSIEPSRSVMNGRDKTNRVDLGEFEVSSVLPFIVEGVLSQIGYVDVMQAAFQAAGLEGEERHFVAALAYKSLPPPERGWHRTLCDKQTAAVSAGTRQDMGPDGFPLGTQIEGSLFSPMDSHLRQLLVEGHNPGWPLLVAQFELMQETFWSVTLGQGCFSLGWFSDTQKLLDTLERYRGSTIMIDDSVSDQGVLSGLSELHLRFLIGVPPGREDHWRPVDRKRTLWTNDLEAPASLLQKHSGKRSELVDSAHLLTTELLNHRPCFARKHQSKPQFQLEQSLALASASALGTIAYELWGADELTDPVQAVYRLGNWSGKVEFKKDLVVVKPMMGRRYQALYEKGLLRDVTDLPWFHGRKLVFSGG